MAQEGSIGAGRQPRLGKLFLMKLSYIADSPADCFHGLCIDSLFCFFKLFFRHSDGVFSKVAAVKELCIVKEALVPTLANLTDNAVHDLGGRQLLTKHLFRPSRHAGGQFHFIKSFLFQEPTDFFCTALSFIKYLHASSSFSTAFKSSTSFLMRSC